MTLRDQKEGESTENFDTSLKAIVSKSPSRDCDDKLGVQHPTLHLSGESTAKGGDRSDSESIDDDEEAAYAYGKHGMENADEFDAENYTSQFAAGFRM